MDILKQILSNKLAATAFTILAVLYSLIIFAPFFAPYSYDADDVLYSYAPPTKVHLINLENKVLRPYIYDQKFVVDKYYKKIYTEDKSKIIPIKFFVKGDPYKFFGLVKTDRHLFGADNSKIFLLGADLKGRDILSRIFYGGRVSLSIGLIAATISLLIGLLVGGIAGYFGGRADNIIMRSCEMIMMIPSFYLILALRASLPTHLTSTQIYMLVVVIMAFIGWASMARIIRGMTMSIREQDFVYAARAIGLSHIKIIIRHVLPHTLSYAIVAVVLSIPGYILGEAALSLIGLGIQEPQASWGNLLSSAMGIINIRLFPWILTPGLFIVITVMSFNVLGEKLRDVLDPKRKVL